MTPHLRDFTGQGRRAFALTASVLMLFVIPVVAWSSSQTVGFRGTVVGKSGEASFGPLRGYVDTFADEAAINLQAVNGSGRPVTVRFSAHDAHRRPVSDVRLPLTLFLPANSAHAVTAIVPVQGTDKRRIQICARFSDRKPLCGRYIARRL